MNSTGNCLLPILAVPLMSALIASGPALAQVSHLRSEQDRSKEVEDEATRVQALATDKCFTSGKGATFLTICISSRGNISRLESPAGEVHLNTREGHIVCFQNQFGVLESAFDAGSAEGGWGVPAVSQPNGPAKFPLIIKRDSLSGRIRLTQTFTMAAGSREVQVTMALKNLTASSFPFVTLDRYFDGDMNGTSGNSISMTRAMTPCGRSMVRVTPPPTPIEG